MIRHMSVNIAGLLRNTGKKSMKGFFTKEDGNPCSDQEARIYIAECQNKGWKLIPMSDKCEGFDPFGSGCPGHETENELIVIAENDPDDEKAKMAMKKLREQFDSTYGWCNDCDGLVCKEKDCCKNTSF